MQQIIYGDVLFLLNFAMDFLSLYICGGILKRRHRTWHLVLAACLGSVYAVASLFASGNRVLTVITSIAAAVLMCYVAYGGKGVVSVSVVFGAVNFMLGGGITALYGFMSEHRNVLVNGEVSTIYSDIPPSMLIGAALISALISMVFGRIRSKSRRSTAVRAEAFGRSVAFDALVDTGNLLREPISGLPAVVVSREIMAEILPPGTLDSFCACSVEQLTDSCPELARKTRLIPASSVTDTALLPAVRCDRVTFDGIEREVVLACGKLEGKCAVAPEL